VRCYSAFLAAIAIVASTAAFSAPLVSGADPEQRTVVRVELDLKTNNDLRAHLENSLDGTMTLEIRRQGEIVKYEVPGEATPAGLKVRFGSLGTIDVAFTPTTTLGSTKPGKGCTGAPRTVREGVFSGTVDFTGERDYVRLEGPATGSMSVIPPWKCPEVEAADPYSPLPLAAAAASGRRDAGEAGAATLSAGTRACSCYFAAGVHHHRGGAKSTFIGYQVENREGMEIVRGVEARAPASAFEFDRAAGTATLHPPSPFSGEATFETLPSHRGRWRSTIQVPLLGADPIDTGAPGFRALLIPEYQFG